MKNIRDFINIKIVCESLSKEEILSKIIELKKANDKLEAEIDELFNDYDNDEESFWNNAPDSSKNRHTKCWNQMLNNDNEMTKLYNQLKQILKL